MSIVYVVCQDLNVASGGIKKLYELVDTLNKNQITSYILHNDLSFKASWFINSTRIMDVKSAKVTYDDIIIFPEVFGENIMHYWPGVRKIILSQNSYYALQMFYGKPQMTKEVYLHKDVVQVVVVSDYDFDLFSWLFPKIKLSKICYGIDTALFHFNPNKKKEVAVMPRKLPSDFNFLHNLLKVKDDLGGFSIKMIDEVSYEECAQILRDSAIFLSFSHKEGFGLPPAEAMACGCIVIGYHGQGGREFFKRELSYPVEPWDMMSYAQILTSVIDEFNTVPEIMQQTGKDASEYILTKHSMANQEKSILNVIREHL